MKRVFSRGPEPPQPPVNSAEGLMRVRTRERPYLDLTIRRQSETWECVEGRALACRDGGWEERTRVWRW